MHGDISWRYSPGIHHESFVITLDNSADIGPGRDGGRNTARPQANGESRSLATRMAAFISYLGKRHVSLPPYGDEVRRTGPSSTTKPVAKNFGGGGRFKVDAGER